jgi:diphthine-ammonia ligase
MPQAIASWSGGKDSCLACYKALKQGYDVRRLLHFVSSGTKRGCFHGIESGLMNLQAEAVGIPLVQKEVSADMDSYEREFKAAVNELKELGLKDMVFGDIYLLEHENWVERVCGEIGVRPFEPLWNKNPVAIMEDFIALGFKALIVSAKADLFNEDFLGRTIDKAMVEELMERKICPCGENGEFHTFVYDGPLFKRRIEITEAKPVLKEGFWKHWFLDIKKFCSHAKE